MRADQEIPWTESDREEYDAYLDGLEADRRTRFERGEEDLRWQMAALDAVEQAMKKPRNYCEICARHYLDNGECDRGLPVGSPHRAIRQIAEDAGLVEVN